MATLGSSRANSRGQLAEGVPCCATLRHQHMLRLPLTRRPAATPAQRAVLSRAVLSRRFELAAERLQGAGFSLGTRQLVELPPVSAWAVTCLVCSRPWPCT